MSALSKPVLCIGNDPVSLNLRCGLLKEHGWDAASSGNAHDGLFRLKRESFCAVILDLNDDGAEGALVASQVKRQDPNIPVVMIITDPEKLLAGATEQADAIVLKSDETEFLPIRLRGLISDR
jgi:DNA-binding NtrC family response regulator